MSSGHKSGGVNRGSRHYTGCVADAGKPSGDAPGPERRHREGARRGAELVQAEFASVVTRKRYCEVVGIHPTTLKRWEAAGVVRPSLKKVMNSPTRVFTPEDVRFGKRLVAALRSSPGKLSVQDAARAVEQG